MTLWIVVLSLKYSRRLRVSLPGPGCPRREGVDQGLGQRRPLLDDGGGRADLDQHRGHAGLPEHRQRHAVGAEVRHAEQPGHDALDRLGEQAAANRFVAVARVEGGARPRTVWFEPKGEVDVGSDSVRLLCLRGVLRVVEGGHGRAVDDQAPSQRCKWCSEATGLADGDVAPCERRRGLSKELPGAHRRDELEGLGTPRRDPAELMEALGAEDPVDRERGVLLELAHRLGGRVTEDAVDAAGVEPQRAESLLELCDVVPALHRGAPVQEAVTEPVPGLDEGLPRLHAADAVDPEPAVLLERFDRRARRAPEAPHFVADGAVAEREEAVLDVSHRLPAVTFAKRQRSEPTGCLPDYR